MIRTVMDGTALYVALPLELLQETPWRAGTLAPAQTPTASRSTNPSMLNRALISAMTVSGIPAHEARAMLAARYEAPDLPAGRLLPVGAPQHNKLDVQGTRSPRCLGISPSTSVPQNSWPFLEFLGYEFLRTNQDGCFVQGRAVKNLKVRRPVMNGSSACEG